MWTVLVRLVVDAHVFSEGLLALFTREDHFVRFGQGMVCNVGVALRALQACGWLTVSTMI